MTHWKSPSKLKFDLRSGRPGMPVERGPEKRPGGTAALAAVPSAILPKGSFLATSQNGTPGHNPTFIS